jgi:hypothetical protein
MLKRHLVWGFLPFFCLQIHSTEIDSFTDRDPLLSDSLHHLNQLMSGYFDEALVSANRMHSCDADTIKTSLINIIGGPLWAPIEYDIEESLIIDKRRSTLRNSVYRNVTLTDGFAMHVAKLGFMLKVGNFFVGSDKFGHFLQQGFDYFERLHTRNGTLEEALSFGEMTENTFFGLATSGVYSYGDLSANYDGMHFWERVTNTRTAPIEPYFTCQDNVWQLNAPFDWMEYLNLAWDEANNCSRYHSKKMTDDIEANIRALSKKRGVRLSCPIEPERCQEMIDRYGNVAPRVITEKCFG